MALADSLPSPADVLAGVRLLWGLPGLLRHPVGPEQSREILRRHLERREANFLTLVRGAVYDNPRNPYRRLLARAGCEYGDLAKQVGQYGIEATLAALYRQGVYLTVDEFKGRRPAIRGGEAIEVTPTLLRNPLSRLHFQVQTGGSRGTPVVVGIDLASVRDQAVNLGLSLDARGGRGWAHGLWSVPGSSAVQLLLRLGACGAPPACWFSQVDPNAGSLHPRYRWSARLVRLGGLMAGVRFPAPVYVPLEDPLPVIRWMHAVLQRGQVPHLTTFASAAVRLCLAAGDAGIDLRGAQFTLGGEPTTEARLAVIRRAGAQALPRYSSIEVGQIGHGCLAPQAPDDVHLTHDRHAIIPVDLERGTVAHDAGTLLVSALSPRASLALLNVSLGDRAAVVRHDCGCPLHGLGWTTHLHTIRSHEKLTAGGMTLLDRDVIRVLEEVLPARFGGGPTDYQLVEDTDGADQPRLRLLVHPAAGPMDPQAVAEAFLSAMGDGSGPEQIVRLLWRGAGFLSVERAVPEMTSSGKVLHLHRRRT